MDGNQSSVSVATSLDVKINVRCSSIRSDVATAVPRFSALILKCSCHVKIGQSGETFIASTLSIEGYHGC